MPSIINDDDVIKIEYFCDECNKQLYPQNAAAYVYACENRDGVPYFWCRQYGEEHMKKCDTNTFHRRTREMHFKDCQKILPRLRTIEEEFKKKKDVV